MTGAFYDRIGESYRARRSSDPWIAAGIFSNLGDARSVINIGAGTGSYEPKDRFVLSVEPSVVMIAQRPVDSAPVVRAIAEALPFADQSFDAAMASLTIHHWSDPARGLQETSRVAPRRIIFGFEPAMVAWFWLVQEYMPEIEELTVRNPSTNLVANQLGGHVRIETVPIPSNCSDGFMCAYWNRPELYLRPDVRSSISVLQQLSPDTIDRAMRALKEDIESGAWDHRHGNLRELSELDLGYRLLISEK
ncbi:MAG: class I SAM-dependent methyltransferase [Actinomycetota bacterium]